MKAVRIHEYGPAANMVYEDAPDPVPAVGEVVVTVEAAGVNPADYKYRSGMFAEVDPRPLPLTLGMDVVGRVSAVGPDVGGFKVGDPVLAMLFLMGNGGYAEQVAVPADWCAPLPSGLDPILAAALPTPASTAVEWIEEGIAAKPGMRILVTGATGAVGRIACFVAKQCGAHVTAAVRPAYVDAVAHADDILVLDGKGAAREGWCDVIADTVGGAPTTGLLRALRAGGVVSTVATDPIGNPDGLEVEIGFFGCHADARKLGRIARNVADGQIIVEVPKTLPLSQAVQAHELVETAQVRKVVMIPDSRS
jgi:NADPH:quinone reductase-like Zn-dependent oxidoreductase